MLRWGQTKVFESLVEYYRGLISLRKQLPGLCDKRMSAAVRISGRTVHRARTMSFFVDNREKGTDVRWESLYIIYNAADSGFEVTLPEGKSWEILADGQEADCRKSAGRKVRVPAVSGMILGQCRQVCPGNGQGRTL
jgi:pullulanase